MYFQTFLSGEFSESVDFESVQNCFDNPQRAGQSNLRFPSISLRGSFRKNVPDSADTVQ